MRDLGFELKSIRCTYYFCGGLLHTLHTVVAATGLMLDLLSGFGLISNNCDIYLF